MLLVDVNENGLVSLWRYQAPYWSQLGTASATIAFPAVSRVIFNACKMGTPLVTSVPNVRLNREIELFRVRSPNNGSFNLIRSIITRPEAELAKSR